LHIRLEYPQKIKKKSNDNFEKKNQKEKKSNDNFEKKGKW